MSHASARPTSRQDDECDCGCQEEQVGTKSLERLKDRVCDGSGTKSWCATKEPHAHCECGLPMRLTEERCAFCVEEREIRERHYRHDQVGRLLSARAFHDSERAGYRGTDKRVRPRRREVVA